MGTTRILYAEDYPLVAEISSRILREAGFDVRHCEDGQDALDTFLRAPVSFDVLITDHEMPTMNGLRLLQEMRTHDFHGPAIVNSGSMDDALRQRYEALGPVQFLAKPGHSKDLVSMVHALPLFSPSHEDSK